MRGALAIAVMCAAAACRPAPHEPAAPSADSHGSFLDRRAATTTALRLDGPSPEHARDWPVPAGAQEVRIASDGRELLAWFAVPPGKTGKLPALVYLHGGFSLAPSDFAKVRPFLDAGFAVLTPSLRGENGNGGRLELLWGELDDAVAAIQWVAERAEVDAARISVIGHSVGGGLAALVSLRPDAPVVATASVGGIYSTQTFGRWSKSKANAGLVRFDPTDPDEVELRVLGPNVAHMVHPHVAYIGTDDTPFIANARAVEATAKQIGKPFRLELVAGDHEGSLAPGLAAWLREQTKGAR